MPIVLVAVVVAVVIVADVAYTDDDALAACVGSECKKLIPTKQRMRQRPLDNCQTIDIDIDAS